MTGVEMFFRFCDHCLLWILGSLIAALLIYWYRCLTDHSIDPTEFGWVSFKGNSNLKETYLKDGFYLYKTQENTWVVQKQHEYFMSRTYKFITEDTMKDIDAFIKDNQEV